MNSQFALYDYLWKKNIIIFNSSDKLHWKFFHWKKLIITVISSMSNNINRILSTRFSHKFLLFFRFPEIMMRYTNKLNC